jgi:DNA-binding MarR family transcriptional regulator
VGIVSSREENIEAIKACMHQLSRAVNPPMAPDWLGLDLTMSQLKALFALAGAGPTTVGELGQILQIQLPAASHTVDCLVRAKLARRYEDPEDRRRTYVELNDRGSTLVEHLREGKRELLQRWLDYLSDDDLVAMLRVLRRLATVAAEHTPRPLPRKGCMRSQTESARSV